MRVPHEFLLHAHGRSGFVQPRTIGVAERMEPDPSQPQLVNGRRSQFAGANFKVSSGEWHELRVEVVGNKITCYYDGDKKIEATDNTFKDAGKVGLWTKADSATYFDNLKVIAK